MFTCKAGDQLPKTARAKIATKLSREAYHLEVPGPGVALDDVRLGADVVNDRPFDHRDEEVRAFGVHLRRQWSAAVRPTLPNASQMHQMHCSHTHRVLNAREAIENDRSVATLHVVNGLRGSVQTHTSQHEGPG